MISKLKIAFDSETPTINLKRNLNNLKSLQSPKNIGGIIKGGDRYDGRYLCLCMQENACRRLS